MYAGAKNHSFKVGIDERSSPMMSWGQDWSGLPSVILLAAKKPHPQLPVAWPLSPELAVTLNRQSEAWQHFGFVSAVGIPSTKNNPWAAWTL